MTYRRRCTGLPDEISANGEVFTNPFYGPAVLSSGVTITPPAMGLASKEATGI
jgi:hypothetical protein